jgi:hypothetical protein
MSEQEEVREFRLEGVGLVVVSIALIAAFSAAFIFGRWFERRSRPETLTTLSEQDPLARVAGGELNDVDESMTFFDSLESADGEAAGDVPEERAPVATTTREETAPDRPDGRWVVQVFAGRQRESADRLIGQLTKAGHKAWLDQEVVGGETLYKVRVGGWDDRSGAEKAAATLKTEGHRGAFPMERP